MFSSNLSSGDLSCRMALTQLLTVVIVVEINKIGCCSVILDWARGANQELEISHSDGFRDI